MLSEKPIPPINTFSQKPSVFFLDETAATILEDELKNETTATLEVMEELSEATVKSSHSNPFMPIDSLFSKLPQDLLGPTNVLNEMLQNMTNLLQEGNLKAALQNVDQVLNKKKLVVNEPSWNFVDDEDELILYIEVPNSTNEMIELSLIDQILVVQLTHKASEYSGEQSEQFSIPIPIFTHPLELTAYYSPNLIEIHIPKQRNTAIPLLIRE